MIFSTSNLLPFLDKVTNTKCLVTYFTEIEILKELQKLKLAFLKK